MTRVLIVDDQDDLRRELHTLLDQHAFDVDEARHGAEALERARHTPPDVVVADVLMPVMDGFSLLRHWKADLRLKRVPFIVHTSTYTSREDEGRARDLGADAFITRPCSPADFLVRLAQVEARLPSSAIAVDRHPPGALLPYDEGLIRELERKTVELQAANLAMRRDLAAREQVEAGLRESQSRFEQLAEHVDDIFWLTDATKGHLFYMSPAYERVWGTSCESLYARPRSWIDGVHPDDRLRLLASLKSQPLGLWEETYRVVRPDGSIRWVKSRAHPVLDGNGRPYRIAGVTRDITETRKLEAKFHQAQKLEAMGRLASGVAHDFNNLLSVILGYTGVILDGLAPGHPLRADLDEVRRAGERASALTRQLLAFTRQQVTQPRVLDLGPVVRAMDTLVRRLVGADITLSLRLPSTPCKAFIDPTQVEQIVMNLVVNARDAMPRGGALTVELANVDLPAVEANEADPPGGPFVRLTVSDTGVGVSPELRERIFEPFFTTKDATRGTGLGLSTVYGIVEQSGGRVSVESEVGATTFTVLLPRTEQLADAPAVSAPAPTSLRGTETVLVVEDDEAVRMVTCTILRRQGYTVLDAQNGGEALLISEVTAAPIHLLLTDLVMPRMRGVDLARRLGAARPDLRVVFMSGDARGSPLDRAITEPPASFVAKPITPQDLLLKVRGALEPTEPR